MFKIYKYTNNPMLKVKSEAYTNNEFTFIKDLFPKVNLLESTPLPLQMIN
jgi:hypothetical protein